MNQKILTKILATMLVLTMTLVNFALLGTKVYALNTSLESQGTSTNNASVNFDAYFKDEKGNKTHTIKTDINSQAMLYLYVSVAEGYLKETTITINNPNFTLITDGVNYDEIENIDTSSNTIILNKIRNGETVELAIPVKAVKSDEISIDMFSKETEIAINGLLVKSNSKTTKIEKTIKVKSEWYGEAEVNLEQGVIKYIPFEQDEEKGIVLQTKIKTNIINSNLPIEKTKIQTVIPTINGISPEKIYVTSDSEKATNGNDGSNFNTSNWNKENNIINIEVSNTVNNNKITWKKDCIDEYILTFIYGEEAYNLSQTENAKISLQTTAEISAYNLETTKITKEDKKEGTLSEKVNDIVMFNVETQETINKGYMYTKADETKYQQTITVDVANEELVNNIIIKENENKFTSQTQDYTADTKYIATKINKENFLKMLGQEGYIKIYNGNNQQIAEINKDSQTEENNYIINYDTKVSSIKIETSKPQTVGKIKIENVKAITNESSYANETIRTFETLKTSITGNVQYNQKEIITKEIEGASILEEPKTKTKTSISNSTLSTIIENENVEIRTVLQSSDITCKLFKNPTIKIQFPEYVENVNFNEAVKILFTDELEIETGTYNPETKTLEVHLKGEQTKYNDVSVAEGPTLVLNVNIKLNELTPSKADEITTTVINGEDKNETKTSLNYIAPVGMVTVNTISGYGENSEIATSVSGQESTGKIETNSNAKTAIVTITLINNNSNVCKNIEILGRTPFEGNKAIATGEDLGSTFTAELTSKIKARTGITNDQITVYYSSNENATKDLSDTSNGWTVEPANLSEIKSYLIVLNNYEMEIGTTLSFEYNTKIPEGLRNDEKAFGTFVVYYDNVIAKETITNEETTEQNNQNTVVVDNTIAQGNTIVANNTIANENTVVVNNTTVENNVTVSQNTINQSTPTTPSTPSTNSQNNITTNEVLIPSQTQASLVGVATTVQPDVKIDITSDLENSALVVEGQTINYTATIVNMGKETLNNLVLSIPVPEGTVQRQYVLGDSYTKDEIISTDATSVEKTIETLEPNATAKIELQVMVKETNKASIQAKAIVSAEGYKEIESETITSYVIKGALNIDMFTYINADGTYKDGDEIQYLTYIKNIKETDIARKVVATCTIPQELEYISSEYLSVYDNDYNQVSYNENTRTVTWTIDNISPKEVKILSLKCKIKPGHSEITNQMSATCSQSTVAAYSNKVTRYVENAKLEVKHYSNIEKEYIDVGENLNYYIEIKNTGNKEANNIQVIDTLPNGVESVYASYETNTISKENIECENKTVTLSGFSLQPEETLKIGIKTKVSKLSNDAKGTIELKNNVKVSADHLEEITANEIIHKIKVKDQDKDTDIDDGKDENNTTPDDNNDENKDDKPEETKNKYSISGTAWLDKSRDGIRDEDEEKLKDIEVTLITKEEAKVVKIAKTNKEGKYEFKEIEKGEYLVIFAFDTKKYGITKYNVEGASEVKNSDAALQQTTFLSNGKTIEGATTDTIEVTNSNIYNIDIGLLESMKFDLSLTKAITKVTKQNDEGIKTYDYTDKPKTLAKVEIPSKQANKTNIIIEYTITIKNEGNIAGYAKNIVDYLPSDLKFSSELNKEWYKAQDGNVYNTSLANTIINPGETKEIKLIVTKTTSENSLGTTNNTAEIYESYNDYGIVDSDSASGNKVAKEDDYGSADILISLNTGTIIMYTSLILSIIAIIGVGGYMIKKKVLGKM